MATSDSELLQQFTRNRSEEAFAALVKRHVDLVYSAALRQVRSAQLAEDVSQTVFLDLSRHADKLASDTILTAWLYRVTRRAAIDVVRSESRRQLREQIAVELADMKSPDLHWNSIAPLLDEAMDSLDEEERSSILLRYFENKSLREVGETLGTSDDAAQKRVSRAVERLREYFSRNGIAVGSGGFVALVSANAVQSAPLALTATISTAAALGVAVKTTGTIAAGKIIIMTTAQKILITTTIAAALGAGIYEMKKSSDLRAELLQTQQKQKPLSDENEQLRRERDNATAELALAQQDNARLQKATAELPKLRGDVARLRSNSGVSIGKDDPSQSAVKLLLDRVNKLKQKLEETPSAKIPELQFLTEKDWVDTVRGNLDTEADLRKAFSLLRMHGERRFLETMQTALLKYIKANNDQFPTDLSQLNPCFESSPSDDILQRYKIVAAENMSHVLNGGDWLITEKTPIDEENDTQWGLGRNGLGCSSYRDAEALNTLAPAVKAFTAAAPTNDDGRVAFTLQQLLPYLTTPKEKAAYEKLMNNRSSGSK